MDLQQYQKDFIEFMLSCGALQFGSFKLNSGRQSPYFMNAGAYDTGAELMKLGEFYARTIKHTFGMKFDVLCGPAYKGIPLAVATSMKLYEMYNKEVRYCATRKEEKDHGADAGRFVGTKLKDGDRILLIEDVVTSGQSINETIQHIRDQEKDIEIVGLVISLDRCERASVEMPKTGIEQELADYGVAPGDTLSQNSALEEISTYYDFPCVAIVTMFDVMGAMDKLLDYSTLRELNHYYQKYGSRGWSQENA